MSNTSNFIKCDYSNKYTKIVYYKDINEILDFVQSDLKYLKITEYKITIPETGMYDLKISITFPDENIRIYTIGSEDMSNLTQIYILLTQSYFYKL